MFPNKLELRGKDSRVIFHKMQQMVPNFKVSGKPVTSDVRSMTLILRFGFYQSTKQKNDRRTIILAHSRFSFQTLSNDILFVWKNSICMLT